MFLLFLLFFYTYTYFFDPIYWSSEWFAMLAW